MKKDLETEYDEFLKSYEEEPRIALRVNTLKLSSADFKETVVFARFAGGAGPSPTEGCAGYR